MVLQDFLLKNNWKEGIDFLDHFPDRPETATQVKIARENHEAQWRTFSCQRCPQACLIPHEFVAQYLERIETYIKNHNTVHHE